MHFFFVFRFNWFDIPFDSIDITSKGRGGHLGIAGERLMNLQDSELEDVFGAHFKNGAAQ